MRKTVLITLFIMGIMAINTNTLLSQSPYLMNYQAVIRDASGQPVTNSELAIQFEIIFDAPDGETVYGEEHLAITNDYGLVSLIIGQGESSQNISDIKWGKGRYYLKVRIEEKEISNTQMLSVPYSLYARNGVAENERENWDAAYGWGNHAEAGYSPITNDFTRLSDTIYYIDGNVGIGTKDPRSTLSVAGTTPNDSAIFEVKNNAGYTIFAVYNEGVRINIDEEYPAKGPKGGFAIGGFDRSKGPIQEYLRVTGDSTRIYVNKATSKGPKGGFAIGGFDKVKAETHNFLDLTPDNYFIGHNAGINTTPGTGNTGKYNSFFGYENGMQNTIGNRNVTMGYQSGMSNSEGVKNVMVGAATGRDGTYLEASTFVGALAGMRSNAWFNTYIGYQAGFNNTAGTRNFFGGIEAGRESTSSYSILIGRRAGHNVSGDYNIYLGYDAGSYPNVHPDPADSNQGNHNIGIGNFSARSLREGDNNIMLGNYAGYGLDNGNNNTILGAYSGYNTGSNQSGNVFIGYQAGYNEGGSDKLYIESSSSSSPLIWGDFFNDRIVIDGNDADNPNNRTLYVNGTAGGDFAWYNDSDRRQKKKISTIENALGKVLQIRGVNFQWKDPERKNTGLQMGFIAQEVKDIIPEVVSYNNKHFSMQYAPLTALLLEAIKEQQKQIEELKEEKQTILELEKMIMDLQSQLNDMKTSGK